MRLRVLELPPVTLGQASEARFIIVFDRCEVEELTHFLNANADLAKQCGAQTTLAFKGEIELGGAA